MAAAALLEGPALDLASFEQRLNKKATFEQAVQELQQQAPHRLGDAAARRLLTRCRTLLRSRYSTRPFWAAGRSLFRAALLAAADDKAWAQQLQEWIRECTVFLDDEPEGSAAGERQTEVLSTSTFAPSGFLFEGQLSGTEQAPPRRPGLLELLESTMDPQLAARVQAQVQAQQQGGDGEQQEQGEEQQGEQQQGERQQQQQPPELSPEQAEALERELDLIAVQLMQETGQQLPPPRAPPASRKLVASLPREVLTADRLAELGGPDVRCPVCMDELGVGSEVQVMPCDGKHIFHPDCAAPWLAQTNSCPTCRHELPTDDWRYEAGKERAKEEEAERRGAANAVSHSEFLYI